MLLLMFLWSGVKPISFTESFRVEADSGPDWALFGSKLEVALGSTQLYILDTDNHRVVVLDFQGRFVSMFGAEGLGPGEFQAPTEIAVNSRGEVFVFDGMRRAYTVFDETGVYLRDGRYPADVVSVFVARFDAEDAALLSTVRFNAQFQQSFSVDVFDAELLQRTTIVEQVSPPTDWARMGEPGFFTSYLKDQFESLAAGVPRGVFCGQIPVIVDQDHPMGYLVESPGGEIRNLQWDCRPSLYTEAMKEATCRGIADEFRANSPFGAQITESVVRSAINQSELPAIQPPVTSMIPANQGFALLVHDQLGKGDGVIWVFDESGQVQRRGTYTGPSNSLELAGPLLVAAGYDENDEGVVVGYRIDSK